MSGAEGLRAGHQQGATSSRASRQGCSPWRTGLRSWCLPSPQLRLPQHPPRSYQRPMQRLTASQLLPRVLPSAHQPSRRVQPQPPRPQRPQRRLSLRVFPRVLPSAHRPTRSVHLQPPRPQRPRRRLSQRAPPRVLPSAHRSPQRLQCPCHPKTGRLPPAPLTNGTTASRKRSRKAERPSDIPVPPQDIVGGDPLDEEEEVLVEEEELEPDTPQQPLLKHGHNGLLPKRPERRGTGGTRAGRERQERAEYRHWRSQCSLIQTFLYPYVGSVNIWYTSEWQASLSARREIQTFQLGRRAQ